MLTYHPLVTTSSTIHKEMARSGVVLIAGKIASAYSLTGISGY